MSIKPWRGWEGDQCLIYGAVVLEGGGEGGGDGRSFLFTISVLFAKDRKDDRPKNLFYFNLSRCLLVYPPCIVSILVLI